MKRLSEIITGFFLNGLLLFTSVMLVCFSSSFAIRNDPFVINNIVSDIDMIDGNFSNYVIGLDDVDNDLYNSELEDFSETFKIYDNLVQSIKSDNNYPSYQFENVTGVKNIVTAGKFYQNQDLYLSLFTKAANKFESLKFDTTSIYLDLASAYHIYDPEVIQNTEIKNPVIYINLGDESSIVSGNFTHFKYDEEGKIDEAKTSANYVVFDKCDGDKFYNSKWSGTIGSSQCAFKFSADNASKEIGEGNCSYLISGKEVYNFRYRYNNEEHFIKSIDDSSPEFNFDLNYGNTRKFNVKGYIGYGGDNNYSCLADALGGNFFLVSDEVFLTTYLPKTYFLKCGNSASWNESAINYIIQHKITTRVFIPGTSDIQQFISEQFASYSNYFKSKLSILIGIGLFVLFIALLLLCFAMARKGDLFIPFYKNKKVSFFANLIVNFLFFLLAILLIKRIIGTYIFNIYFTGLNSFSILLSLILLITFSGMEAFAKKEIVNNKNSVKEVKLIKTGPFDVPVCLMFFLRNDKLLKIIDVVRKVKPTKVYLLSDGPRNEEEKVIISNIRTEVEKAIDWDTEIVKMYNEENVGVCQNIGGGALKVLEGEENAIFLEDDNLPSESFFYYCRAMLNEYKTDARILWVNGTNYLGNSLEDKNKYYFTKHLLPCGWATWADKFKKYYDINLDSFNDEVKKLTFKKSYEDYRLYNQQLVSITNEFNRIKNGEKALSWDYQMVYSLRSNNLYGIAPSVNLINNIGVDELSIHGGISTDNIMTKRFCGVPTNELPEVIYGSYNLVIDQEFEYRTNDIILLPFKQRIKNRLKKIIKRFFGQKFLDKILAKKRK